MDPYRFIDRTVASLGAPIRTYRRKPIMGLGPVVLTALFAAFVWYGASSHEKLEGAAWLMTVLAIAAAIVYAFELYRTRIAGRHAAHEARRARGATRARGALVRSVRRDVAAALRSES